MKYYIVTEGDRIVGGWKTEWDSYSEDPDKPERKTIEVKKEEYEEMSGQFELFTYKDKPVKKPKKEIDEIKTNREANTLVGLRAKIEELEKLTKK